MNLILRIFVIALVLVQVADAAEKHLILDNRIVQETDNARLTVGTIVKHPANPLFKEDKPWEVRFDNLYANILYDEEDELYKCWYSPFIRDNQDKPPKEQWDDVPYRPRNREMGICYATSKDGLSWQKPELGLVEFAGSKANNLVLHGPHGAGVFKDAHDKDPQRRYKVFYKGSGSMEVRVSPDGLHWSKGLPAAGISVAGDTHNNAFWAPDLNQYVGITRTWDGQRIVARSESRDFETWRPAVEVLRGNVQNQTYAMPTFRYANVYLGLVMILRRADDRVHCELTWSPDTLTWHRVDQGNALIPLSEKRGDYDWGCVYAAAYPVIMSDGHIRLYYGASNFRHTSWRDGFLALATLRPDGWAGYQPQAPDAPATVRTKPISAAPGRLHLTADATGGGVRVSLLNLSGKVLARSKVIAGDVTDAPVMWEDGFELSRLAGNRVQLEFKITDARLYSFTFGAPSSTNEVP